MPDEYYPEMNEEPQGDTTEPIEEGGDDNTALLPKSVLGGKKFQVGDEVVLKVVHLYEDEVEVAYASEPPKEETKPAEPTANEELESMAKE